MLCVPREEWVCACGMGVCTPREGLVCARPGRDGCVYAQGEMGVCTPREGWVCALSVPRNRRVRPGIG